MRRLLCISCVLTLLGARPSAAQDGAASFRDVRDHLRTPKAKIVNGVLEAQYHSVGALLVGSDPDTASTLCSGTLIGCETFLTAGHCVDGFDAGDLFVFLPSAGFFAVAGITLHPAFDFPVTDFAAPVNGVAPSLLNTVASPSPGTAGTIVGYGRTGGSNEDYGLKRRGPVSTVACPASPFYAGSVCWLFSNPLGPPGSNSNTCNGDSGGPLFVDFGQGDTVAGVTSGGTSDNCNANDLSYDLDVFRQLAFIESAGGADLLNTTCGSLPQAGEPLAPLAGAAGEVSAIAPQALHTFQVPPATTVLRVAMTGSEEFPNDFDLYVKAGSPPTTVDYDCRDFGPNQYGFCELASPASGAWYVMAHRFSGGGAYQISVTSFGRDCSLPANDGLACNDDNECSANDVCNGGTCSGTAVTDGTPCDDGNQCTAPDACQAGACTGADLPDGAACDDGNGCTRPDTCQGGDCNGASPAQACKMPFVGGRAVLRLKDKSPNAGDRLLWRWVRGTQTAKSEFGDPTAATDYSLCIYDEVGGVPVRVLEQHIPAGGKWTELSTGFKYRDRSITESGIFAFFLREGADGAAKIVVKGKSHPLGMPPLALQQDSKVTVQLVQRDACWQADYSTSLRNDSEQFKARAD
jgi:hypothetical protein